MPESYVDQLAHVQGLAEEGFECVLNDFDLEALKAVLTHYDAYAAVGDAAMDLARYDDLTAPVQDLSNPDEPEFLNMARLVLHEALMTLSELA